MPLCFHLLLFKHSAASNPTRGVIVQMASRASLVNFAHPQLVQSTLLGLALPILIPKRLQIAIWNVRMEVPAVPVPNQSVTALIYWEV